MNIVKSNISKYLPTKVDIDKYCIQGDVTKALYCVMKHKSVKFAEILNCLNKVFLQLKCCFARKLKFMLASLIVHQLNLFMDFQLPDHRVIPVTILTLDRIDYILLSSCVDRLLTMSRSMVNMHFISRVVNKLQYIWLYILLSRMRKLRFHKFCQKFCI